MIEQSIEQFWGPQLGPMVMSMLMVFIGCVVFGPPIALVSWLFDRAVKQERR